MIDLRYIFIVHPEDLGHTLAHSPQLIQPSITFAFIGHPFCEPPGGGE